MTISAPGSEWSMCTPMPTTITCNQYIILHRLGRQNVSTLLHRLGRLEENMKHPRMTPTSYTGSIACEVGMTYACQQQYLIDSFNEAANNNDVLITTWELTFFNNEQLQQSSIVHLCTCIHDDVWAKSEIYYNVLPTCL
jgi:hypothetical protein